ncbi:anion transporter [Thermaerobacter marianensis DSM 12885]|uniref:Sodium-dependent dicarboxylate transporter SdcS n=1 Tax=Thermaerobacter marianensis (strain ATCC 700841 / DSM 12885 / JCM 10246 / 7p75a) TaxID=644966 RepID=E6SIF5_THEM7|nr:DASS family sodium-coupled anion symporter [Thermaerobacter marianensis]ADU51966.1 anion transporter [Thermaerobacter marianensis DSM 12885]
MQVSVGRALQQQAEHITPKSSHAKLWVGGGAVAVYLILSHLPLPSGLTPEGLRAIAFMVAALILWMFEVVPLAVSSALLVLLMGPLKIVPNKDAMANFMTPTLLFILSAFIVATCFIKVGLGNRVSLLVSGMFGNRPDRVLLSFMLPTAAVSTVLTDIPTAVIFSSIAYPLLVKNGCEPGRSNFGKAMMLGIPMAAAIGGIGTPAGSGLNVLAISLLKSTAQVEINFIQWTVIGLPLAMVLTLVAWWILLRFYPPEMETIAGLEDIARTRQDQGAITKQEKMFLIIFGAALVLWFTQPWNKIDLAVVAICAATLFFLPGIDLLTWDDVKGRISWDVLMLLGAANSLAMALWNTKAATWIANSLLGGLAPAGVITALLVVVSFGIFSHLVLPVAGATLAVTIPVLSGLAVKMGINPALFAIPLGFTASCVFLVPLDPIPLTTYHYRYWTFPDMIKPGFVVSLVWIVLLVIEMYVAATFGLV